MSPALGSPIDVNNRRILIIDDNEMIHQDFAKILSPPQDQNAAIDSMAASLFGAPAEPAMRPRESFELVAALQGEEGLRKVRAARASGAAFALAFVDMRMPPGWDGLETIDRIWESDPDLQIVICTAYSDHSWEEITRRLGHSDRLLILKKPFDAVEVLQLAHALTEKWALARRLQNHLRELETMVAERTRELRVTNADLSQEVSQHKEAIRQLAEVKLKIERMLRVLPLALIGVGADGRVSHWNAVAQELLGVSVEQAVGALLSDVPARWTTSAVLALVAQACSGTAAGEREVGFTRADGQEGFLLISAAPMPGDGGSLVYATDVTERRLLEQHLMQAQKLEAIGQLAAGVAHEINTPVQFIGDNLLFLKTAFGDIADLLERYRQLTHAGSDGPAAGEVIADIGAAEARVDLPYLKGEIPKAIEQSVGGVHQISKIVSAMRDFAHPPTLTRRWLSIDAVIESVLNVSRNEYKYVADIVVDLARDLPKVSGQAVQLNQVLLNLVVNAAHAIAEKGKGRGTITIAARVDGPFIEMRVTDTGAGIPERIRHHIFEPFFTTKGVGKGTGQGLYLSREIIVKHHGGEFAFTSVEGKGTTFIIRLPIAGGGSDDSGAPAVTL